VKLPAVSINPVPEEIMSRHSNVTLSIDIMYVTSVPFLSAISKELKIGHPVLGASRHDVVIAKALKRIIAKYERRGFSVKQVGADEELEHLVNVDFDFAGKDDHEPTIERFIRTIKDSCRSQRNMLPFKYVPKAIIRHLVLNSVFWWNALPGERGPLDTYSGHYVLTGVHVDYNQHIRIPFGTNAQTHEAHDNSMAARTTPTIALGPTGIQRGSHCFLS
jgi:hypothetical protein